MGISASTHIGTFVRCKFRDIGSTESVKCCSNDACKNSSKYYGSDKFCSLCGSKIGTKNVPVTVNSVNCQDIIELMNDRLCTPGGDSIYELMNATKEHIYVGNILIPNARKDSFGGHSGDQLFSVTADMIASEKSFFSSFYAKEIALLKEKYGDDQVSVDWGVIHSYS